MRVNKYTFELSTGKTLRVVGTTNEKAARRLAEKEVEKPRHAGAKVGNLKEIERGRWG
ncbi:hypothetical protein [Streptomyces sp. NPDC046862]|uniref:hypothetical protein n=1 Tax=Streptomyces sp. NPDC046862 TaxID=3154603 RepID=UPI0034522FEE